jgi:hypothetical protein
MLLKKLKIELSYDPSIPLLVIYPKECKSTYSSDSGMPTFITSLLTIANIRTQPRCPSIDGQIKENMVYINNGVLFAHKEEQNYVICKIMDGTRDHVK